MQLLFDYKSNLKKLLIKENQHPAVKSYSDMRKCCEIYEINKTKHVYSLRASHFSLPVCARFLYSFLVTESFPALDRVGRT